MAIDNDNKAFAAKLFKAADKLRKNIDAAEYKNVVLGLIFLKYVSDAFQEYYDHLAQDEYSDPEDRNEYLAENIFFVPEKARWNSLQQRAKSPEIGMAIDDAMLSIEKENPALKNVLPVVFAKPNLDKSALGQLVDLVSDTNLQAKHNQTNDLLGHVYEYFLGEFANAEGKKGGQFYTPDSIVKLMVNMIEPYKGRVYDPACGSGGMFVMSDKFVSEHQSNVQDITLSKRQSRRKTPNLEISIYGQESNQTTWKLSKMNLAIRKINSQFVSWNPEGSFLNNAHPDLKAHFILANPPFNQKEWGQRILEDDPRWKYGVPPAGNANYAWMQHMLFHLGEKGVMATVLANGSLSSNTRGEGEIRQKLVENNLVECIVALPKQLFYNTGIPATIWILRKNRTQNPDTTLFIDASEMGYMKDRTHRAFKDADIDKITNIYHNWRNNTGDYADIKGFCKVASRNEIENHRFVLTPGRYVGIPDEEDDGIPFEEKMAGLLTTLAAQMEKEQDLNSQIKTELAKIGFTL